MLGKVVVDWPHELEAQQRHVRQKGKKAPQISITISQPRQNARQSEPGILSESERERESVSGKSLRLHFVVNDGNDIQLAPPSPPIIFMN